MYWTFIVQVIPSQCFRKFKMFTWRWEHEKKKNGTRYFYRIYLEICRCFFYSVCLFVFQENFNSKLSSKELNTSVKFWNLKKFIFHLVKASCNRNYFMPWSTNDVEIISEKENIMDIKVNASHYQSCWRCFSH